jgi:chromate transporter
MGLFFLKIGATLFGSGYVLLSYLQSGDVLRPVMDDRQIHDAVAVGQVTPGPLLTTATFVGYVFTHRVWHGHPLAGPAGALLATAAIFLPSFILVALLGPWLTRLRHNRLARGALDAMNAAVAALILVPLLKMAAPLATGLDPLLLAITAATALALFVWDLNSTWLVLAAAGVGLARHLLTAR